MLKVERGLCQCTWSLVSRIPGTFLPKNRIQGNLPSTTGKNNDKEKRSGKMTGNLEMTGNREKVEIGKLPKTENRSLKSRSRIYGKTRKSEK